jgi:lysophospholipase L1-like esterase
LHNWKYKDEFITDYKGMVNEFRSLQCKPEIFLLRPAPVTRKVKSSVNKERLQEIIHMIDRLAVDLHAGVIDVHTPLLGHPEWIPDGVHPNTAGAAEIAMTVYRVLREIQKR